MRSNREPIPLRCSLLHRRLLSMQKWLWLCWFPLIFSCAREKIPATYFPDSGKAAVHQLVTELRSDFKVLDVALEPGFEDLSTLAYFRLHRGASVMAAYVSNGEAGDSDLGAAYPPYLAAERRAEAAAALSRIDGEVYFLNLPHVVAARDRAGVRASWPADSLIARLERVISTFKPDVVLLSADLRTPNSPMQQCLQSDLLAAVQKAKDEDGWPVLSVFAETDGGISAPLTDRHPLWKRNYLEIGAELHSRYQSLEKQFPHWGVSEPRRYRRLLPPARAGSLEEGLPFEPTPALRWIVDQVQFLCGQIEAGNDQGLLRHFVPTLDSINLKLAQRYRLQPREIRTLLRYNLRLEKLRCLLRGISAQYSISDTCLTDRQLTYLTIDAVHGIDNSKETNVFFGLDSRWAVNEDYKKRFPLQLGEPYRILTPKGLNYTEPAALYGLDDAQPTYPLYFFIMQYSQKREENFILRSRIDLTFAPKFSAEVLTPIVRAIPGAAVVLRLQNNSRDGVSDTLKVDHEAVAAAPAIYHLPVKGAVELDTLRLLFDSRLPEGSTLVPVRSGDFVIAKFVVRNFAVSVDSSRRIAFATWRENSPLAFALRNLGVRAKRLRRAGGLNNRIFDTIILDHRLLTFSPTWQKSGEALRNFASGGGTVIVLSQDAAALNRSKLLPGLQCTPVSDSPPDQIPRAASGHSLLEKPNPITESEWSGWLYAMSRNRFEPIGADAGWRPVLKDERGAPLIVERREGRGKIVAVNLALEPQLLNVHPGALRLLANLISY